jgi:hypothetical protein
MKTLFAFAFMLVAAPAVAAEDCYGSFDEAAQAGVRDTEFTAHMEFLTGHIFSVPGETLVLRQGRASNEGDVMHLQRVVSSTGSEAMVTSRYTVFEGKMVAVSHCVSGAQVAL